MNDKLFKRVSFFNVLMNFFNKYCDLAQFAMTTGSLRRPQDYDRIIDALQSASRFSKELIGMIPKGESESFKNDMTAFLSLIGRRLDNIAERHMRLRGKSFNGEQYSFFEDRRYIKTDRAFEKEISRLGVKINQYKSETKQMLES